MAVVKAEDIKMIYEHIGNAESREIFANRLFYSLTVDVEYIRRVVRMTTEGDEFCRRIMGSGQKKVIFGAGIWGVKF